MISFYYQNLKNTKIYRYLYLLYKAGNNDFELNAKANTYMYTYTVIPYAGGEEMK